MIEQSIVVHIGGGTMRIDFTGGMLSASGYRSAKYRTSNPVVQKAIESCQKFKDGVIVIHSMEGEMAKEPEIKKPKMDDYPGVTNMQMAKSILMSIHNVPMAELGSRDIIKSKAKELNVTFSNWN